MATRTTSGFSAPIMAGYWFIQLKTSGRARPVPERKARTTRTFLWPATSRCSCALRPTAIMESPTRATTRGLAGSTGGRSGRSMVRGTLSTMGVSAPSAGAVCADALRAPAGAVGQAAGCGEDDAGALVALAVTLAVSAESSDQPMRARFSSVLSRNAPKPSGLSVRCTACVAGTATVRSGPTSSPLAQFARPSLSSSKPATTKPASSKKSCRVV